MAFSIFSLNLWNLNQNFRDRMQRLDEYMSEARPDIVCLQEVSPITSAGRPQSDLVCTLRPEMTRLYSSQYRWDEREEGLATLSTLPLVSFESFMLPAAKGDGLRRLQIAAFDYRGQRMLVANTHLAFRHEQHDERLAQCETIISHLTAASVYHQTDGIILVGDFNTTPASPPITSIKGSQLGLRDLFEGTELRRTRNTYPDTGSYFDGDAASVRWIDFVFVTDRFEVLSSGLAMDGRTGGYVSDHVALEARLELSAQGPATKPAGE